jgi:hypothetical protein
MSGSEVTTTYATPRITAVANNLLNIGSDSFPGFDSINCHFINQFPHDRHGFVNRAANNFAKTYSLDEIRRLASYYQHPAHSAAKGSEGCEDSFGIHAVCVGSGIDRLVLEIRLDHEDRSRPIATLHRIDQNERVVTLKQLKREMHSANPVIFDLDSRGKNVVGEPPRDLDTETVISEKDITDSGDHHPVHRLTSSGSTSSG